MRREKARSGGGAQGEQGRAAINLTDEDVDAVGKSKVSLRLDTEVLEWFRSEGKGYQTRINAVLRAHMRKIRRSRAG